MAEVKEVINWFRANAAELSFEKMWDALPTASKVDLAAFEAWLSLDNFDQRGQPKRSLRAIRAAMEAEREAMAADEWEWRAPADDSGTVLEICLGRHQPGVGTH